MQRGKDFLRKVTSKRAVLSPRQHDIEAAGEADSKPAFEQGLLLVIRGDSAEPEFHVVIRTCIN